MREFAVGAGTYFGVCVLFWILLPPGLTALAIVALTVVVGVGGTVLIGQHEQRKHDNLYRMPYRRQLPPTIEAESWED